MKKILLVCMIICVPVVCFAEIGAIGKFIEKSKHCNGIKKEIVQLVLQDVIDEVKLQQLKKDFFESECNFVEENMEMPEPKPMIDGQPVKCDDGTLPNEHGCCTGEVYTDMGDKGFNCCPSGGGECFPPIFR